MKHILILVIAFAFNSQLMAAPSHCTYADQDADSFFKALVMLRKKLAYGLRLPAASFELTKDIKINSEFNPRSGKYNHSQYTDHVVMSKECFVEIRVYSNDDNSKNDIFKKGHGHKFNTQDEKFRLFKRSYNMYGKTELFVEDDKMGMEIIALEKCSALQVSQGLRQLGVNSKFIGPKNDPVCHPEANKIAQDNSGRAAKQVVGQSTIYYQQPNGAKQD